MNPAEAGFLSPGLDVSIKQIRARFQPWFKVASQFSELGMRVLSLLGPRASNNQKILAILCFVRTLTSFQGALILAERGLVSDARTVIRAATETTIVLAASVREPSVVDSLVRGHFLHHRKLQSAWLADVEAVAMLKPEQIEAIRISVAATNQDLENRKTDRAFTIEDLAKMASLLGLYNAVFRVTSGDAAHLSIDSLNRHAASNAAGELTGFNFGPQEADLADTLSVAISTLAAALDSVIQFLELPGVSEDFTKCVSAWKALGIPNEFVPS